MNAPRTRRRLVALVAILAIVTAQSVAAAYACMRGADAPATVETAPPPCPDQVHAGAVDASDAQGNLCEVHCQATPVPSPGYAAIAPPPDVFLGVPLRLAVADGVPAAPPEAKGAAPPLRSQYCRLQL